MTPWLVGQVHRPEEHGRSGVRCSLRAGRGQQGGQLQSGRRGRICHVLCKPIPLQHRRRVALFVRSSWPSSARRQVAVNQAVLCPAMWNCGGHEPGLRPGCGPGSGRCGQSDHNAQGRLRGFAPCHHPCYLVSTLFSFLQGRNRAHRQALRAGQRNLYLH